jgi:hypothetical protein
MIELHSLNLFAEFFLAALLGIALFFGLLALPMFVSGEWPGAADRRGSRRTHRERASDSTCPCPCLSAGGGQSS